ncbi:MAG: hypothetical protein N2448_03100 [Caloramator sp.]|nr:hypothetical protein [Caloramator sp.]
MIKHKEILNFLENEGLEEIDEIEYNKDIFVYNFFYVFDEAEIEAAKEYANENCDVESTEEEWNEEFYLPYLTDIAADNVRDIVDDICEEFDLTGEFIAYQMDIGSSERCEFTVVFAKEGLEFDIDEIIEELDL